MDSSWPAISSIVLHEHSNRRPYHYPLTTALTDPGPYLQFPFKPPYSDAKSAVGCPLPGSFEIASTDLHSRPAALSRLPKKKSSELCIVGTSLIYTLLL